MTLAPTPNPITVTLDIEDHLARYAPDGRYVDNTRRILAFLAERKVRGTFFTVGRVAEAVPKLVREIAAARHEIACHSYRHRTLDRETSQSFREETRRAKDLLEQAAGVPVVGYRAPLFSLTRKTAWALDELSALGFRYSSSVLPAVGAQFGFPGLARLPFRWPNGLVEFPVPLAEFGPVRLPFLGGVYLRYLPGWLTRRLAKQADPKAVLWTYMHPYDFDAGEPWGRMPDTPLWVNLMCWFHRSGTWDKLGKLLDGGTGKPLGDLAAEAPIPLLDDLRGAKSNP